jgi:AmmeMemoRadiSam system protein A
MGAMAAKKSDALLTDETKQKLHRIAREAIASQLDGREYLMEPDTELDYKRGAFVTLKIDGELRGCIGQVRARDPLHKVIADMAVAAAFDDPRFPTLTKDEYGRLEYEISVLTPWSG